MSRREDLKLNLNGTEVGAYLGIPEQPKGVVLFAHGSGSSRQSPRNQYVAETLQEAGLATVLVDLLTKEESNDRANVFDVNLLSERLIAATNWVESEPRLTRLPIGYFGASTGAAAALKASAGQAGRIRAIVSRGGRPDLAMEALPHVHAPTLLIVGGHDFGIIEMNRRAFERLNVAKDFAVVQRATHLFEEPGALEDVSDFARDWFTRFFARPRTEDAFTVPSQAP